MLEKSSELALACHVNPDPDALGSMLGLAAFLDARGKKTVCSFGNDPFAVPRWASLLSDSASLVEPKLFPKSPDVLLTLDTASLDRLGSLAGRVAKAREVVWIDHHVSNEGLGTVPVIDPKASSTAEIVFRLMKVMGGTVPPDAAASLYAGLITDTGRFQYESVTAETLELAAELRSYPFDHARLAQALYEDNSLSYLAALGTALRRVTFVPEFELAWTYLTQADLADAGVGPSETDDLIDVVRTAREADVAVVMKQQRDGRFKVSMRSRGANDVAAAAAAFGGGGHRLAAGYTSDTGVEETVRRLAEELGRAKGR
ncbi:MAG: bifunctional oligoribonuclease/PAP phosphatase NrnA [Actinomycetota bacterium]